MSRPIYQHKLNDVPCLRMLLASVAICAASAHGGFALEPTPADPSDTPPDVVADQQVAPVASQLIVKYADSAADRVQSLQSAQGAAAALSELAGAQIEHVRLMSGNAQVVQINNLGALSAGEVAETIQDIAARLSADPAIEYVEPDAIMQIQQAVNDPRYGDQWHYTKPATGIDLPGGWAHATGNGVVTAVIDTGYRPHVDLAANILPGYDFITNTTVANDGNARDNDARDPGDWIAASDSSWCPLSPRSSSWHGTHVAGTVAAVTNNALGVAGIARDARIVPVRVLGKCGGNLSDIADGMRWAAGLPVPGVPNNPNPASVLNLSLGGGGACGPTYQSAVDDITATGASVVVAAGNSNADATNYRPASCDGVITVAATNTDGARSYYSNFGSAVEIAAPGGETYQVSSRGVLSTLNAGATTPGADSYAFYQGTSMAAPHVAGVAALLYQLSPGITPAQVSITLQNTAQSFPSVSSNQCTTANCGAGILDAGAAAAAVAPASGSVSLPWLSLLLNP